jgi:pimeloyl-ACP methyl ester carboxylesterase
VAAICVLSLTVVGLLGVAVLAERWLEGQDAKRVAGSDTFVNVGGAQLRYRLAGAGQRGPAVVLLGGFSASMEQWDRVQTTVASFATVLAYDRGGYGFSRGSTAHNAQQQADELAGLLSALSLDRPIVLVGFSTGASIARVFIGRYRKQVSGLVLASPHMPEMEGRIVGHHGLIRDSARWLLRESVTTLFGLKRLVGLLTIRENPLRPNAVEQKITAIEMRFSHWWAVDRELLATPTTARQTLAADPLRDLPLILLADGTWSKGETGRVRDEIYRSLIARSGRGSLRNLDPGHADLHDFVGDMILAPVKDGVAYQALIDAIRELASMTC